MARGIHKNSKKQRTFMLMLIVCIKKFKVNLISITNSIEKHKIRVENEMGAVLHIKWLICVCALTIIQNAPWPQIQKNGTQKMYSKWVSAKWRVSHKESSQWDSVNVNGYDGSKSKGEVLFSLRAGFSISTRVLSNAYFYVLVLRWMCVCVYF